MAKNVHGVPKKQWKKWGPIAQAMFNRTYHALIQARHVILPRSVSLTFRQHHVWVWNASWLAADEADGLMKHIEAKGLIE